MDPPLTPFDRHSFLLLTQVFSFDLHPGPEYRYGFLFPTDLVSLVYQPSKITKSG